MGCLNALIRIDSSEDTWFYVDHLFSRVNIDPILSYWRLRDPCVFVFEQEPFVFTQFSKPKAKCRRWRRCRREGMTIRDDSSDEESESDPEVSRLEIPPTVFESAVESVKVNRSKQLYSSGLCCLRQDLLGVLSGWSDFDFSTVLVEIVCDYLSCGGGKSSMWQDEPFMLQVVGLDVQPQYCHVSHAISSVKKPLQKASVFREDVLPTSISILSQEFPINATQEKEGALPTSSSTSISRNLWRRHVWPILLVAGVVASLVLSRKLKA